LRKGIHDPRWPVDICRTITIGKKGLVFGKGSCLARMSGDAERLSLAESLLDQGMTPRGLMKELGLGPATLDLRNYNPAQPRVPAGSGRESGRWGPGGGAIPAQDDGNTDARHQRPNIILAADKTTPDGFGLNAKAQRRMEKRGVTQEQIDEAVRSGPRIDAINRATDGAATRYVNPNTGPSVVIDNATNQVIHVGEPGFEYGPGSGDVPGAVMRPAPLAPVPPATIIEEPIIVPEVLLPP